jgi:hypothetical protein
MVNNIQEEHLVAFGTMLFSSQYLLGFQSLHEGIVKNRFFSPSSCHLSGQGGAAKETTV